MNEIPSAIDQIVTPMRTGRVGGGFRNGTQPQENQTAEDEANASHAIFYSITSTQSSLRGIDMGHLLIKQAVQK